MIVWSIIPEAAIFAEPETEQPWQQSEYLGCQVLLRPLDAGYGEIVSVISSNPSDFLNTQLQPGTRVPLNQVQA